MFSNREELIYARQHLNLMQGKLEQQLQALKIQFDLWEDDNANPDTIAELVAKCCEFRNLLKQHHECVGEDGLLEKAITQHPSLIPAMQELEKWQQATLADWNKLIIELQSNSTPRPNAAYFREEIRRLHNELISQEQQERHLLERGLT
jgi:uncharacterized coiled-coil DUF342 family protein